MRNPTLPFPTLVVILTAGRFCSWLHAQPPPELGTVTGTVTEAGTDQPVAGVTVTLTPKTEGEVGVGLTGGQAVTDEQGQFTLKDVVEGRYTLSLSSQEYQSSSQELEVTPQVAPLVLTVKPWPRIRGQLRGADGTPVANAQIQGQLTRLEQFEGGPTAISIATDEEGHYQVPAPQPGRHLLTLTVPGLGYARSGELTVTAEDLEGVDLQLAPGASVAGQVRVRGTDQPPGQVRLSLEERGKEAVLSRYSSLLDEQGRFVFRDLPPGTYQVEAGGADYLRKPPQRLPLAEGQAVTDFALEVSPVQVLSGRLLAPDGTPVANQEAEFQAYVQWEENYAHWGGNNRLKLDDQGGFTLRFTREGLTYIYLGLAGVGYLREDLEIPARADRANLEWRLKPFLKIAGQVRERRTREPLAGVSVSLRLRERDPSFLGSSPQVTSGADGRFELPDLVAGEYDVSVNAPGYRYSGWPRIRVGQEAVPKELLIEPERGTPVAGRMLGPDGKTPMAGARVSIPMGRFNPDLERTTDAEGRFSFASVAWGNSLRVEAEGFAGVRVPLRLEGPDHPVAVTLTLRDRGGSVTGQVRHGDTPPPVAGGIVLAFDPLVSLGTDPSYFLPELVSRGEPPGAEIDLNGWPWRELKGLPMARTDAAGRYELTHLTEGEYTVYAVAPGQGSARRENVAVREGQGTADIDFGISSSPAQARRNGRLTGRLTGPDGKPLANVTLHFQISSQEGWTRGSVQTDADGRYGLDLPSWGNRPYGLAIKIAGYRAARREGIEVNQADTAENVDFQLAVQPLGSLAGRVFLPAFPPSPGSQVGAGRGAGGEGAAGVWVVPLRPGSTWADPTSDPVSGVLDGTEYVAGKSRATVTDAEGRYRIDRLEAGDYRIYALPHDSPYGGLPVRPDDAPPWDPRLAEAAPVLSDLVAVPENGVGEANVTLGQTGLLEGVIRSAETGQPLADVSVCAQFGRGRGLPFEPGYRKPVFDPNWPGWGGDFEAWTDAQGQFRIPGLPAGTYQLWTSGPDARPAEKEVTVVAGATATTELRLRETRPITVAGRVLLPDGRTPAPRSYVWLYNRNSDGGELPVRTDAAGHFELILPPAPGQLRVVARKVGCGRAASDWFHLAPGGEKRDLTVTLTAAGTISGQIVWEAENGPDGPNYQREDVVVAAIAPEEPLAGINPGQPWRRSIQGMYRRARLDENGRFTLTDVPAGRNTLVVFVKNIPQLVQPDVMMPADGAPVGVGLVPALTLTVPPARGKISGTVTRADNGTPLGEVYVTVCNELINLDRLSVPTDDQGHYTLSGLPAGTYQVLAHGSSESSLWASQASAEIRVGDGPVANVNFHLSPGGEVTGTVLGPDGRPITGTLVSTAPLENGWPGRIPAGLSEASAVANGDGTYRLEHLAPGEYTLYAAAPGCAEARQAKVVVREGETTQVDFTLGNAPRQASRLDGEPELVAKLRTERADNRFTDPDADLPLTLAVWNRGKETRELDVAYTVTHGDGGRVAAGRDRFTFGPQRVTPFTFTVRPGQRGVFHAVVRLQGDEVDLTKTLDFEVQRPGQAVAEAIPSAIEIRAEATRPEGVFEIGGEPPSFSVVVDYHDAPYQWLTLEVAARDDRGNLILEGEEPFATEKFRYTRCPVRVPVAEPGHYQVEFRLAAQEGLATATATATATFSVRERAEAGHAIERGARL